MFGMFAFATVFDSTLSRDRRRDDIAEFDDVQRIIRDGIVYPLRKYACTLF